MSDPLFFPSESLFRLQKTSESLEKPDEWIPNLEEDVSTTSSNGLKE